MDTKAVIFGLLALGTVHPQTISTMNIVNDGIGTGVPSRAWLGTAITLAIKGCLIHAVFDFQVQNLSITHLLIILCVVKMTSRKVERGVPCA